MCYPKKVKVAHTRLPSAGFRSWSRFLAVSLLVMWVINSTVGCHYFSPGLQLPPQPLRGLLPILLLGERWVWTVCLRLLRLRFKPGPFCAWVQHANHSATEPPVLPWRRYMAICVAGAAASQSVFGRNVWTDRAGVWPGDFFRSILHCVVKNFSLPIYKMKWTLF